MDSYFSEIFMKKYRLILLINIFVKSDVEYVEMKVTFQQTNIQTECISSVLEIIR